MEVQKEKASFPGSSHRQIRCEAWFWQGQSSLWDPTTTEHPGAKTCSGHVQLFIPNLPTVGQPLYELLRSKSVWTWDHPHQEALQQIKKCLSTSPARPLTLYDVNRPTTVPADCRWGAAAAAWWGLETSGILLTSSVWHRNQICTDWEGILSKCVGLWQIWEVPVWPWKL